MLTPEKIKKPCYYFRQHGLQIASIGNPAASNKALGFPSPPRDGFGFIDTHYIGIIAEKL
jgi:hypothetical protein